jgi:hypothetical protein
MTRILFLYYNVKITAHVEYLKFVCLYSPIIIKYMATWEGSMEESRTRNLGVGGKIIVKQKRVANKRNLLNQHQIRHEIGFKKSLEWILG